MVFYNATGGGLILIPGRPTKPRDLSRERERRTFANPSLTLPARTEAKPILFPLTYSVFIGERNQPLDESDQSEDEQDRWIKGDPIEEN